MKDSVNDILVTGDQSLTDIISCCKSNKTVWYQIAPWKKGLADQLSKYFKYFKTYKTSCGTLKAINLNLKVNWKDFMKKYDFRVNGKRITDSIIISNYYMKKGKKEDKELFKVLLELINKSRRKDIILKKFNKWFYDTNNINKLTKKNKRKNKRTIKRKK